MTRLTLGAICAAALVSLIDAAPVKAHPHVLVNAKSELTFDASKRMTSVRHVWTFDEAFSAYASEGLDANNDGKLSVGELAPLAKVNVESLEEFGFFTSISTTRAKLKLGPATDYHLEFQLGRLTLFFTLPLTTPTAVTGLTTLSVFDPTYFVAFSFEKDRPLTLAKAPAQCTTNSRPPKALDAQTSALLSTIPPDQRALPPDLAAVALGLAIVVTIACE